MVESVGCYDHKFLVAAMRTRAGLIIGMSKLDPQAKLPQVSVLKKATIPCLYAKFKEAHAQTAK
jgi:hypothetical protein